MMETIRWIVEDIFYAALYIAFTAGVYVLWAKRWKK